MTLSEALLDPVVVGVVVNGMSSADERQRQAPDVQFGMWAARDSNPARRIKSPELYQMS
jgi:hypothetical protein